MKTDSIIKWAITGGIILLLSVLYSVYHPGEVIYFPKCPFKAITGYNCPGCGSQRAVYYLLNLDFPEAFQENIILIFLIPYVLTGYIFNMIRRPNGLQLIWRNRLFGEKAIYFLLALIIAFWILRNLTFFPYKI